MATAGAEELMEYKRLDGAKGMGRIWRLTPPACWRRRKRIDGALGASRLPVHYLDCLVGGLNALKLYLSLGLSSVGPASANNGVVYIT
jgi:hypothetical protein